MMCCSPTRNVSVIIFCFSSAHFADVSMIELGGDTILGEEASVDEEDA